MRSEHLDGRVVLHGGDCLEIMASLPENSVDSVICDPPYHLTSIVKRFGADGQPLPLTAAQKRYGDGSYSDVPLGHNPEVQQFNRLSRGFMGKVWDGGDIAFRPETWAAALRVLKPGGYILAFASTRGFGRMSVAIEDAGFITHPMVAWIFGTGFPKATRVKADGYDGFRYGGQALKPAIEPIYMGQKPFSEETGTANILRWGTGALNIDGCRVETDEVTGWGGKGAGGNTWDETNNGLGKDGKARPVQGRWPANIVHDGSDEVVAAFPDVGAAKASNRGLQHSGRHGGLADIGGNVKDGTDTVRGHNDNGGSAARFFYSSKANKQDRIGSKHPTVKPVDLMQWLCRLVTPPGGTVLDPFAGSGSTGEAAWREGFQCVLIEREPEYQADIAERLRLADKGPLERKKRAIKQTADIGGLFANDNGELRACA